MYNIIMILKGDLQQIFNLPVPLLLDGIRWGRGTQGRSKVIDIIMKILGK